MYRFLCPMSCFLLVSPVVSSQALYCPLPSPTTNPFTESPQMSSAASHEPTEASVTHRSVSLAVSFFKTYRYRFVRASNLPTWGLQGIIYPLKVKIEI